ncbi:protein insensitive-like [Aethina tumida]|uniref:protein insensitive-like n=1 Tax=Aethina tumida TaxID=116153 RepID=UPI0021492107|nr:protein insensitive-like [Aethina tumida]
MKKERVSDVSSARQEGGYPEAQEPEEQLKIKSECGSDIETPSSSEKDEEWLPRKVKQSETNANVSVTETPKKKEKKEEEIVSRVALNNMEVVDGYVTIGSLGTKVLADSYDRVDWSCCAKATRGLMDLLFSRPVMATSSLSGKRSPAFKDKQIKPQLNPVIINDITECVMRELKELNVLKSAVRHVMTTKCADECKLLKKQSSEKRSVKRKYHSL